MSNILNAFDGGDLAEISALIDKLEKSSFDYLKLESDGVSIVIGKYGAGEDGSLAAPSAGAVGAASYPTIFETSSKTDMHGVVVPKVGAPIAEPASVAEPTSSADVVEQEGVVIVRSPNYGLFYAQSEPGAPPYTSIGAFVTAGDTLGLLETMKTFTAISSPSNGEVVAIHVKNEETLEPGQPLVSIKL